MMKIEEKVTNIRKNKMKISHEVPIQLLKDSLRFNDYQYCLVHLLDEYPEYKKHFMEFSKTGGDIILDNSIFELGTAFDADKFADKIRELKPTQYIIPDVLDDGPATIENYKKFVSKYDDLPGIKIGVVQGKTYDEFKKCYEFMSTNADKISIPFTASCFNNMTNYTNKLDKWCYGRPITIFKLQEDDVWNFDKPHHLLGCSLYKEFKNSRKFYKKSNIVSLDTSNPVVAGIDRIEYNDINGLTIKPSAKLFELLDTILDEEQLDVINYNIAKFREGINER